MSLKRPPPPPPIEPSSKQFSASIRTFMIDTNWLMIQRHKESSEDAIRSSSQNSSTARNEKNHGKKKRSWGRGIGQDDVKKEIGQGEC